MLSTNRFFGSDKTRAEYLALELTKIHEQHRDTAELLQCRWFDYRYMLPAELTYLFAAVYRSEYIAAYKRTVDIGTANSVCPFAPKDIFESRDLTSMWIARQEADRLGVKYGFFMQFVFDRFATRGWRNLPRPNQLYAEELLLDIRDAWALRCQEVMQLAESPFYLEKNYVRHPYQDEYHSWVIAQIKQRPHRHFALSRALREGHLPKQVAIEALGESTYERAVST